jgi:hypothetical protein
MKKKIKKQAEVIVRPTAKDFEMWSHDCWGVSERTVDEFDYIIALNKYVDYLENKIK